ncbi:5-formyltetrahydrofolate cyclo-ligase [Paenibacillus phyllosphaerae]|uniref:5-formyltetrahydrofolate cyclo-ligase n=1 Tax=Paenibacillus phyllosphaerae TaxID=274593 RepID=A0A7W5B0B6_9BACL|nr:5-formyltetrahydrofolate cyclo-ligase [Paenibacillus phyllosphaerae]MBB3112083.1 5-formyltetrahydrofolate cyclo-ligase [Paenibacillus phyllosphaerae]
MKEMKQAARQEAAARREQLPELLRAELSERACMEAKAWLERQQAESFMIYADFRSELRTWPLIEWGIRHNKTVIVPRCLPQDRSMELYAINGRSDLAAGAYGIMEPNPASARRISLQEQLPDAVFVPGLAFDRDGGRLGYGGGYYDRFRDRMEEAAARLGRSLPPWIGLAYEAQWVDGIPMEAHDARVDGVITENGIALVHKES